MGGRRSQGLGLGSGRGFRQGRGLRGQACWGRSAAHATVEDSGGGLCTARLELAQLSEQHLLLLLQFKDQITVGRHLCPQLLLGMCTEFLE